MTPLPRVGLLTALVIAGALGVPTGRAQEPQQQPPSPPPPVFRTGVDLVRVDVSVTGGDDKMVTDLQPPDFEVKEDGVLQQVQTAQFVRISGTRTVNTDESLDIRSVEHAEAEASRDDVRVFAIFLDDYHVDKSQLITLRVRKALKDFVRQFGPNDLVAVMDPLTPLSSLRFTRSHEDLLARMEAFEGRLHQVWPVRSVMEESQLTQRNIWELRGAVTLSALESLVTYLGGLREGRKSVLFVSQGPTINRLDGEGESRIRAVLQSANRGNVTINAFDPRPLGSVPFGGDDTVGRLTSETGGRAIVNVNEPAAQLTQTIADASAYYLLGYMPTRTIADGKFHRIEVRVKRRGVRVLARRGYWSPSAEELHPSVAGVSPEPGVTAALAALVEPREGRAVDVWVGASRGENDRTRLTIAWEPAARAGGRPAARLEIEPLPEPRGTGPAATTSPSDPRAIDRSQTTTFDLAPAGRAAFRFTAHAADGAVTDQWDRTFTVPVLWGTPFALSTPRFLRARSAFEARALDAGQDPPPAASRQFRPSDRVAVDVECYAAEDERPSVSARLLNARGETLIELGRPRVIGITSRFILPLGSLAPGAYVLRLDGGAAPHSVQERSAFQVVP